MQKPRVDLANGVNPRWADSTPNDGRGEDGAAVGAGEAVGLIGVANAVDVAKHPEGDASLGEGAEDGG